MEMNLKFEDDNIWGSNLNILNGNDGNDEMFLKDYESNSLDYEIQAVDYIGITTESNSSKNYSPSYKHESDHHSKNEGKTVVKVFNIKKSDKYENSILKSNNTIDNNKSTFQNPDNISLVERIKLKKEKAKLKLLEKKREKSDETLRESSAIDTVSIKSEEINPKPQGEQKISKNEMKAIRNRISAQLSRERKKKEFDDLQLYSQRLLDENKKLKKEILSRNVDFSNLNTKLKKLCNNCSVIFEDLNKNKTDSSNIRFATSSMFKFGITTSFVVTLCIVGSLFNGNLNLEKPNVTPNIQQVRNLVENVNFEQIYDKNQNPVFLDHDESEVQENNNDKNHYKELKVEIPPKNLDDTQTTIDVSDEENNLEIEENSEEMYDGSTALATTSQPKNNDIEFTFHGKKFNIGDLNLNKYLNKKRMEYLNKFYQRQHEEMKKRNKNKNLFLKRDKGEQKICANEHKFIWSVMDEREISPNNSSIKNSLVPYTSPGSERRFNENIKSVFCPNFMSDTKGLFSRIIENILKGDSSKQNEDCLYMHLLFPGDSYDNEFVNSESKRQTFYEIGCKIIEINKIYK